MKRWALLLVIIPFMFSCEKDNASTYEIINQSGVDWYNAQAWYSNSVEGDFTTYIEIGNVSIGESVTISTEDLYVLISGDDFRGDLVMSERMLLSGTKVTVRNSNMLTR